MTKARIRWIAGISLVSIAVVAGGAYFLQLWRKASLKAAAVAAKDDEGQGPEKDDNPQPIPTEPEEGDDTEPPTDLSSFGPPRGGLSQRSPTKLTVDDDDDRPPPSGLGGGSEFGADELGSPRGKVADKGGSFDGEDTPPPPAFRGSPTTSGGGFSAKTDDNDNELAAPGRLDDDNQPPARFAGGASESNAKSSRKPGSAFKNDTPKPSVDLDDDPPADLISPAKPATSRSAFDNRGARGAKLTGGISAAKIDGPHEGGQGAPGPRQLEGVQAPSLALEKAAPTEIQVGKPATFQIKVRNVGQVDAHDVVVHDEVPKGTKFVDATPQAGREDNGTLSWQLGVIRPGEEQTISMQLMPTEEGEIGSVARVSFQAQASARTISTRPQLKIEHTAPPKVLIGQGVSLAIKITNPGTGAATNVVLEEDVPDGLSHPAGNELEFEVGTLRPGESKTLELTLKAEKPGQITNVLVVRGDAGLSAEDRVSIEVIAPQLEVDVKGPSRRFLDRQATYVFSVANRGTAAAKEVELAAFLPKGFKFVETNNAGQYDPQKHAVFWSLAELPASEAGTVQLIAIPVEPGEQKLRVEGRADLGLADSREQSVVVESVAQLLFDVTDSADPIEVGSDTVYQVRIVNQGTKTATNVRVAAQVPAELQAVGGNGPGKAEVEGQRVLFEPLARLAPKGEAVYRIQVRGLKAGDPRIRVQVACDEIQSPVTKEEATKVYSDQ